MELEDLPIRLLRKKEEQGESQFKFGRMSLSQARHRDPNTNSAYQVPIARPSPCPRPIHSTRSRHVQLTRAQALVGPLELLAWRKVLSLGVDALVVVDVILLFETGEY